MNELGVQVDRYGGVHPNVKIEITLDTSYFATVTELLKEVRKFMAEKDLTGKVMMKRIVTRDPQDESTGHPEQYIMYVDGFEFTTVKDSAHLDELPKVF